MNANQKAGASAHAPANTTISTTQNYTDIFRSAKEHARNNWIGILAGFGLGDFLKRGHGPCPLCGGRDRYRFDDKNGDGTWFCNQCGAGDGIALLSRWLRRPSLEIVREILGVPMAYDYRASSAQDRKVILTEKRREGIERTWTQTERILLGTPPWLYLTRTRGLSLRLLRLVPNDLRYHPNLEYWNEGQLVGTFPAMVAAVRTLDGTLVSIHRTYLDDWGKKAPVPQPKKLMPPIYDGATRGAAINLYEAQEQLGVAEGIETAIACHLETGMPVWSTVSASGMESIKLPSHLKEVVIFADNDANRRGEQAARKLSDRLVSDGTMRVKLLIPPITGTDWLDFVGGGTK
jgi:putative DNA primase/helicase